MGLTPAEGEGRDRAESDKPFCSAAPQRTRVRHITVQEFVQPSRERVSQPGTKQLAVVDISFKLWD